MDAREFQALELAARANIKWTGDHWLVHSFSKRIYKVNEAVTNCTCDDFELADRPCKHMLAVGHVKARNRGTPVPLPATYEETVKERPARKTYPQNWPAYNAAQTNERRVFHRLLADLCSTVPEPERPKDKGGRKPVPVRDALFAVMSKVHSGFSTRRFMTDLRASEEAGFTSETPHYNFISKTLEKESTTPILRELIVRSSLPLSAVEDTFAIDASGVSSNKFARWFDAKYGVEKKEYLWVKLHICVGTKTNVVTAVEISDSHDSQQFPALLRTTMENFTVRDVCCDKAYLSREIIEQVYHAGGTAYIPFKPNNRPDTNGEVWKSLFHFFHLHRDEFLKHYHQRSNVETTFSMIKKKFGDSVRSKSVTAMRNEVLAKVLCHNLVVLVHEMYELGIDPTFGEMVVAEPEAVADEPRILRFPGA